VNKKERAKKIGEILDLLFPRPEIPLIHSDPYTLLIAVMLSAQCTDARVNTVTPHLFAMAHTPLAMAQCAVADIERIIRPCGLAPTKAKAIQRLSKILVDKYAGEVPSHLKKLKELPGVGQKTASVVMSQAFYKPAFPVDTHIHRCAKRWGLATGKSVADTEKSLKRLFPSKEWNRRHLQMIYFARRYCPARGHDSARCPICSWLPLAN
jgi:endonuclease-3